MSSITVKEIKERKIEVLPCVKCGSEDIDLHDCGYSTFNVAYGRCRGCKNEIKLSPAPWNLDIELLAKSWNEANNPKILRTKYEQQISELQEKINKLPPG